MRKFLFIAALFMSACSFAQHDASFAVTNPVIAITGSFSQPAVYAPSGVSRYVQIFPWYSKLDTVNNTGTGKKSFKIATKVSSIYTWCHVTSISGTDSNCTMTLWASADSSLGVDSIQLYTSKIATTITNPYGLLINSGNGWPYTNAWWTFHGTGTHSTSWYCGLMIR